MMAAMNSRNLKVVSDGKANGFTRAGPLPRVALWKQAALENHRPHDTVRQH